MGKVIYKTQKDIDGIRASCLIVCEALTEVAKNIKPGITGKQLDEIAEQYIRDQGAKPGFKGYHGFPATLCISINEGVVHGIPTDEPIESGDIVSVDCGALLNGYYGDSAYTFAVGDVSDELMELLAVTNDSLYMGIKEAEVGNRLGDIGFAVQNYVEREHNFSVVRELVGHGIGKELHEPPEVPNYGKRGRGQKLKEGLVIAIEPMVNKGRKEVTQKSDGWTIITKDRTPSAHFEHTIAVTAEGPMILTDHIMIEKALEKNSNVKKLSSKNQIFAAALKEGSQN